MDKVRWYQQTGFMKSINMSDQSFSTESSPNMLNGHAMYSRNRQVSLVGLHKEVIHNILP